MDKEIEQETGGADDEPEDEYASFVPKDGKNLHETLDKKEQEEILKKHGYSDEEIKDMKKEDDRVEAILQKQKFVGSIYHK